MSTKSIVPADADFFTEVRAILAQARQRAYGAINSVMVEAYWQIGRRIVEQEQRGKQRAGYGEALIKELSKRLSQEFGSGFAVANLKNFRQFYLIFPDEGKGYSVRSFLTWTHYRLIMRVSNASAREYYIREAAEQNWSTRQLERNIRTLYYERLLSSQDKPSLIAEANLDTQTPRDFVKDPYVLEFLNIPELSETTERGLETAIIANLQQFLLEIGKGFSFVARQMRISTETNHFYIDLVFYNYLLKCFVVFDLKTGKLTHENIGQMDMYVRMFDDLKRGSDDNPTIGIILCTDHDETMVKYSVLKGSEQLFAAKYFSILPTEQELIAEVTRQRNRFMEQQQAYID